MPRAATVAVSILIAVLLSCGKTAADEPASLQLLDNSPGLSQIIAINRDGHAIGSKEVEIPRIGFSEGGFYWDGHAEIAMPLLAGYSNTQLTALSDTGLAVGYASRVLGSKGGNMEACAWNPSAGTIIGLGRLPNHRGSHAFDISGDGTVVVGYSTGPNPPTMVPCVWQLSDGTWTCQALPVIHEFNPYLLTGRIVISDDGSKIAACITVEVVQRPESRFYASSTFIWQRDPDGNWQREKISENQLRLANINNRGRIVGSVLVDGTLRAYVLDLDGQFRLLDLLCGDVSSAANDVNNDGTVVGYSDDPPGPDGGPTAFLWNDDQGVRPIEIPVPTIFSSAASINDAGDIAGYLCHEASAEQPERTASFILKRQPSSAE